MKTVLYIAGVLGFTMAGLPGPAVAAAQHTSFTNSAGVSYASPYSPAIWNFHSNPAGGSMTDGTNLNHDKYTAKVVCVSFLSGHKVYWGAQVTSGVKPGGDSFVFWYAKAGGPGAGQVAGEPYATKVCYNGHNGSMAGPTLTITGGQITVR